MTFSSRAMKLCLVLLCSREVKLFYIVFDTKFTKSVFQKYFTPNFLFFYQNSPKTGSGCIMNVGSHTHQDFLFKVNILAYSDRRIFHLSLIPCIRCAEITMHGFYSTKYGPFL